MQKTNTIGVIVHELNSYFITSVLAGIEKIASEAKYNLIIVHSAENPKLESANVTKYVQSQTVASPRRTE